MKSLFLIVLSATAFFLNDCTPPKEHFSGAWLVISSNVNGDKTMPKDTLKGVLKVININKGTYFFQIFGNRFLLDRVAEDSLVGPSESIKYIKKNNHIIFDMGNGRAGKGYLGGTGESIFEFKRIN